MVAGSETLSTQTRASRIVAEALVEGYPPEEIVQRARSMGLSRGLTDVLLAACPCRVASQNTPLPAKAEPAGRSTGTFNS
jgi:hypothetical protein